MSHPDAVMRVTGVRHIYLITVVIKYEDKDLDFRYIAQKADIMDKISMGEKVNPTKSGGSDKGRSVS